MRRGGRSLGKKATPRTAKEAAQVDVEAQDYIGAVFLYKLSNFTWVTYCDNVFIQVKQAI